MSCIYNSELFEIMNIFQILQKMSLVPSYLWDKMWAPVWKRCMKHCGKGVYIRPMSSDFKGLWNLSVGDGTSIPKGSTIYCTDAACTIGKKVLFGPKPTIITGDHRIDILGKYIADVTVEDKFVDGVNVYDQPVVIEDDVWCECYYPQRCDYRAWFGSGCWCCCH